jgi:hypothetical protein
MSRAVVKIKNEKSKSMRLSEEIVEEARRSVGATFRTATAQIEYWARIGKVVEGALTNQELAELLFKKVKKKTKEKILKYANKSQSEVLAVVEADVKNKTSGSKMILSNSWYEMNKSMPGCIDKIYSDGKIETY